MSPYSEERQAIAHAAPRWRQPVVQPGRAYSRFVGWMKFVLPAIALVLLGMVLVWPMIDKTGDQILDTTEELARTGPLRNFEMANPRYEGTDDKGRPFVLTASRARQDEIGANEVALSSPRARVTLENGNFLTITAEGGEFRQRERILTLRGDVNIYHDAGYTFKTELAQLNMAENTAHGDQAVIATGPKGNLEAEGFRVLDDGETVIFTGHSRVILNLTDQDMRQMTGGPMGQ